MDILFTGFTPFGGERVNPAWEAVSRLPARVMGAHIRRLEVPTAFTASGETLTAALRSLRPDAVICVGQAGGRTAITPERIAINLMDARIPDNHGFQPSDMPVCPDGPAAYFSTLPLRAIEARIRAAGIPVSLSCTAGTFVCNSLMYRALRLAEQEYPAMRAGFIHVPYETGQVIGKPVGTPSLSLDHIIRALICAAEAVVDVSAAQIERSTAP